MRVGVDRRPAAGELFAEGDLDYLVGTEVELILYDVSYGMATVLEVQIREGGLVAGIAVEAIETPELVAALQAGKY